MVGADFTPTHEWCLPVLAQSYCQDGELHLLATGSSPTYKSTGTSGTFRDFVMQVQMRSVIDSGAYGLAIRGQGNPRTFLIFGISTKGQYQVLKWSVGSPVTTVKPLTDSTAIKKGQATNLLQVIAQGQQIALSANGEQLVSITETTLTEGAVGLIVYEQGHVAASNLRVWAQP
jgi:hypothetical protein